MGIVNGRSNVWLNKTSYQLNGKIFQKQLEVVCRIFVHLHEVCKKDQESLIGESMS